MDRDRTEEELRPRSAFLRWTVYRPVTIFMAFVALLVVGALAYPRIPLQLAPAGLSTGGIYIWIQVPDFEPRECVEQVTKPTEDLIRTVPGVREIFSSSNSDYVQIHVEFNADVDGDLMVAEVRDRVDRAKLEWPDGIDHYSTWRGRMDNDMPVYIASVGFEVDSEKVDTNDVFDTIFQNRILAIDGVARVDFWGLTEKRVTIDLDNDRVSAHSVPLHTLVQRLQNDNVNVTCGKIRDGSKEFLVRSIGKFSDFDDVLAYPVNPSLEIGDIGEVGYQRAVRSRLSRVDGTLSTAVVVYRDSMANAIELSERIERIVERELPHELPALYPEIHDMVINPWWNEGQVIQVSIDSLRESGAWGALFAMAVLYAFFRHLRITVLVTLAIPFSLLITVIWIYFRDGSFNILSLMGMSLGIGMLVDNSIVVVENIVRKQEGGLERREAAVSGVREIGLAVTLATLTTVVVLLPVLFLGDPRFKAIFQEIGIPLCVSVLASLAVALIFVPQAVLHFYRARRMEGGAVESVAAGLAPSRLNRATLGVLRWCLAHRFESFCLLIAILATSIFAGKNLEKRDGIQEGANRVGFRVYLPKNLSLREANDIFAKIEESFEPHREKLKIRAISCWFDSHDGFMQFYMHKGVRVTEEEFHKKARPHFPRIPDVRVNFGGDAFTAEKWGDTVRVYIRGNDFRAFDALKERVLRDLTDPRLFPELVEVERLSPVMREEVRVEVDREVAQYYGVDAGSVATMLSWAIRGARLPDFEAPQRELPFWIRFQDADKESVAELNAVPVYRADGRVVRLENLASYDVYRSKPTIRRRNGKMTIGFKARAETDNLFDLERRVERHFQRYTLPQGFEITTKPGGYGFEENMENTFFSLILAVSLVFFVMGALFESFVLPFSVLLSVPHAFFGSLWLLYLTGVALDPGGMVGMIMLVGIVVNNAIVLVDSINRRRQAGLERQVAILEAARIRFRPIWMTALTTLFGLLPLALLPQKGEGMDYKSMAVVLIGGLATSTFFTLFVVPLFYSLLDDLRHWGFAIIGRAFHKSAAD